MAGARVVWVVRGLLAALFVAAGVMKLAATEFEVNSFARFGYAPWFMYLIGVLELAGGIGLLLARSLMPATLGLVGIMVGAVFSHLNAGDPPGMAAPAVVVLALLVGLLALRWRGQGAQRLAA